MLHPVQITVPTLVRMKPGALDRIGLYCRRLGFRRVALFTSDGIVESLGDRVVGALARESIDTIVRRVVEHASFEQAQAVFAALPGQIDAILGLGGGKALDVSKYAAFLARLPYIAIPTSLSNDGFCSPQSSLTLGGRRRSLPAALPIGVVLDTDICLASPLPLFCSGVGDLSAKLTAVRDWKLAFEAAGTIVDDLAALLSDASVYQFLARPNRDNEGVRLLATALMLNGIAMEICGSSRPASGSEHLISHALDSLSARPRLHGLQVGIATYLVSHAQGGADTETLRTLFDRSGLFDVVAEDPFSRAEWERAIRMAPSIKQNFYTILHARDFTGDLLRLTQDDPILARCFVD